jgi:hypothetical protein
MSSPGMRRLIRSDELAMRLTPICVAAVFCLLAQPPLRASGEVSARTAVTAGAVIGRRAAVQTSTDVLQFRVTGDGRPARASISYRAGARTATGSDVRLFVHLAAAAALDGEASLTLAGGGADAPAGSVSGIPTLAARWTGAGLRSGELWFELRAAPGTYRIPVTFELTVP